MAKLESYGAGLLPLALAAGILSGGFFRQSPASEASKPTPKPAEQVRPTEDTVPNAWLSDLRPVMEAMGEAMGLSLQRDAVTRATDITGAQINNIQPANVVQASTAVRRGLQDRLSTAAGDCDANALKTDEQTLNAYLLSDEDSGSSSRKLRSSVAEAALKELQDWRSLATLARNVGQGAASYRVQFIIATIPDYVDSNAGWSADQSLAAIQSAMSRSRYVLDRFRLIDWTRADPRSDNPVANESHLHERQPGALIFRSQEGNRILLQVVLLVLETPTSGVHRAALRNGIRFIRAWNQCTGVTLRESHLRVLGPTFSGSSLSMALTLNDPGDGFADDFSAIRVISGSATADSNVDVFRTFAPAATFDAAVPPTSETRRIMSTFLEDMNPAWKQGAGVAFLLESNTAYGQTPTDNADKSGDPFDRASVFYFPLHVSQLRNDAPAAPTSAVTLLPTPAVPLNMRETTPPADQIPALRPQLTSSVVESTVDTILDTIRHEKLSAVGIQATDDRDVLFLAREVKRAAPDVQLFFLGTHALYLHQDYVPYLRGTLVASPYPLSLITQAGFKEASVRGREPFQSMPAEGLFNATLLLLDPDSDRLLDYCDPGPVPEAKEPCRPRVAISVIGEDGFWPLAGAERTAAASYVQAANAGRIFNPRPVPPLPTQAVVVAILLGVFVLAQLLMLVVIGVQLWHGMPTRSFLEWPVLRVFAPPVTYGSARKAYRIGMLLCFAVVALISTWVTAVVVMFELPASSRSFPASTATLLAGGLALAPAALLIAMPQSLTGLPRDWPQAARKKSSWLLIFVLALFVLSGWFFGAYVVGLLRESASPSDLDLTLARLVGGGIVSPGPATLCLFAGLYAGTFAAVRRASLVGNGYTQLEEGSLAFDLVNGRSIRGDRASHLRPNRARLGDVLDMPAQNLPLTYVLAIPLVIVIAGFSVGKVSTVDGRAFTSFLCFASATILSFGLLNLAQGLLIWNTARAHLKWLALSPIEGAFKSIAHLVPWDLTLAPPRLMELVPAVMRADQIVGELGTLADPVLLPQSVRSRATDRHETLTDLDRQLREARLGVRKGDLAAYDSQNVPATNVSTLEKEMGEHQHAAFLQSDSWLQLWKVADAIVTLLQGTAWKRILSERRGHHHETTGLPVVLNVSSLPELTPAHVGIVQRMKMAAVLEASTTHTTEPQRSTPMGQPALLQQCQEFVALQFAFVLRDIVARTVAALFTAMLCLTFLTAAHLLYSFNGRSALLTVDLLAVAATAMTSIWILVGMERETVLSRLRNTTPGRLDINWAFVQRLTVYGVLPLLAVLASLFPEIGNSLFGWLEPLRKLSNF